MKHFRSASFTTMINQKEQYYSRNPDKSLRLETEVPDLSPLLDLNLKYRIPLKVCKYLETNIFWKRYKLETRKHLLLSTVEQAVENCHLFVCGKLKNAETYLERKIQDLKYKNIKENINKATT